MMLSAREVSGPEQTGGPRRRESQETRWNNHAPVDKDNYKRGTIVNFPHVVLCEANGPNAVQTQFGWFCFKTRYGIVIDNTTELEVLKLGTSGGRGPLSKPIQVRVDCFGLKKAEDAEFYCWDEELGSKVACTPEKGVYDIEVGCPYQPKTGAFGNVLDVIPLPHDSRIQVCGEIGEDVLNAILKKRNRRLLQKQSTSTPKDMWIEELEARLDKDKHTHQDADDKTRPEQTKQDQQPSQNRQQGAQLQDQGLQGRSVHGVTRRRAPDSDTTMRTAPTKRAKTDISMLTPAPAIRDSSQAEAINGQRNSSRWRGPSYQLPPDRVNGARRFTGPGSNDGSNRPPQNAPRQPRRGNSRPIRRSSGSHGNIIEDQARANGRPEPAPGNDDRSTETRRRRNSGTDDRLLCLLHGALFEVQGSRRANMSSAANSTTADYEYQPLDYATQQIRLVTLLDPLENDDTIRLDIDVFEISKAPPYTALSYVWGPPSSNAIYIADGRLEIRDNLFRFLTEFRKCRDKTPSDQYLWIDQICINQWTISERNHQVQMMSDIYSKATSVIAWLGDGSEKACAPPELLAERGCDPLDKIYGLLGLPYFDINVSRD
ncbi:uncharacterized protein J4E88_006925 [Alternaria novae-zelandiae]|uniref:uncharacterized protein n=1 Tax=Alternaria novae-zelandiae TaxID=430562 RepID=UPI0020C4108F|nr:uncharacterized protein J4E88_006925 [Alternaria novae-zelandiae]KAI4677118.1 hypothetical protein J4E88_006925 [Alternaria novae-zelandiae]